MVMQLQVNWIDLPTSMFLAKKNQIMVISGILNTKIEYEGAFVFPYVWRGFTVSQLEWFTIVVINLLFIWR